MSVSKDFSISAFVNTHTLSRYLTQHSLTHPSITPVLSIVFSGFLKRKLDLPQLFELSNSCR